MQNLFAKTSFGQLFRNLFRSPIRMTSFQALEKEQQEQEYLSFSSTKIVSIDPSLLSQISSDNNEPLSTFKGVPVVGHDISKVLSESVNLLKKGHVIGLPTETVYGLAANALSPLATKRIFAAKNRPRDNPLICHVDSIQMVSMIADISAISPVASKLMNRFWPGPLTLLLPAKKEVPVEVTGGLGTVGVRMPLHPIARAIIHLCGFPLAAPSANASGRPSPTKAEHVVYDLNGKIPLVVDGGESQSGIESTVIDVSANIPIILRPGAISHNAIRECIGEVHIYGVDIKRDALFEDKPSTPGMKYRHYSPVSPVFLFINKIQTIKFLKQ